MSLTHNSETCTGRWERHGSNGVLFWECLLCGAAGYERPQNGRGAHLPQLAPQGSVACRVDLSRAA